MANPARRHSERRAPAPHWTWVPPSCGPSSWSPASPCQGTPAPPPSCPLWPASSPRCSSQACLQGKHTRKSGAPMLPNYPSCSGVRHSCKDTSGPNLNPNPKTPTCWIQIFGNEDHRATKGFMLVKLVQDLKGKAG